MEEVTLAYS